MRKIVGAIRLMRPWNGVIASLTLIPAVALGSGRLAFPLREAVAAFFIASFGYVLNDLYDLRSDKINKPWRVIPSRVLSAWQGINVALLCLVLAFVSLVGSGAAVMIFFAVVAVALFLYASKLSSVLIISNLWVALLCSSAFLLGGLITHAPAPKRWLLAAAAAVTFLYHLGREIIKDIEDVPGDRIAGRQTLPIVCGEQKAKVVAATVFALMVAATYCMYLAFRLPVAFLLVVTPGVNLPVVLIQFLLFSKGEASARRASQMLKLVMLPALASLLIAGLA